MHAAGHMDMSGVGIQVLHVIVESYGTVRMGIACVLWVALAPEEFRRSQVSRQTVTWQQPLGCGLPRYQLSNSSTTVCCSLFSSCGISMCLPVIPAHKAGSILEH
jgi:hypothetical protein